MSIATVTKIQIKPSLNKNNKINLSPRYFSNQNPKQAGREKIKYQGTAKRMSSMTESKKQTVPEGHSEEIMYFNDRLTKTSVQTSRVGTLRMLLTDF